MHCHETVNAMSCNASVTFGTGTVMTGTVVCHARDFSCVTDRYNPSHNIHSPSRDN